MLASQTTTQQPEGSHFKGVFWAGMSILVLVRVIHYSQSTPRLPDMEQIGIQTQRGVAMVSSKQTGSTETVIDVLSTSKHVYIPANIPITLGNICATINTASHAPSH